MTITGADALIYTIGFLVPGFLLHWVMSSFTVQKKEEGQVLLLRFLTFSCLNYALWSWLLFIVIQPEFRLSHPYTAAFCFALIVLVSPVALGVLAGRLCQRDFVRSKLHGLGCAPLHGVPNAWDYKFSRTGPSWVVVTLKGGKRVSGYFGSRSFASSDGEERDLFIEQVWTVQEGGQWVAVERSAGILIAADQISYIEFKSVM